MTKRRVLLEIDNVELFDRVKQNGTAVLGASLTAVMLASDCAPEKITLKMHGVSVVRETSLPPEGRRCRSYNEQGDQCAKRARANDWFCAIHYHRTRCGTLMLES